MHVGWGPQEGINASPQPPSIAVLTQSTGELLPFLLARVSRRAGFERMEDGGGGRQTVGLYPANTPLTTSTVGSVLFRRTAVEVLVKNAQFPTWPYLC